MIDPVYGWRPDKPDHRDTSFRLKFREKRQAVYLPDTVDLRSGMPSVYDQKSLGSCTGNAIAAAIEFARRKEGLEDFVPSRLFIYYNERSIEGTIDSDSGAEIRDGIKSVVKYGACSEDDWPYDTDQFTTEPDEECYEDARKDLVKTYASVDQTEIDIKSCLALGYPVVFGFSVYESFESDEVACTGIVNMPGPTERQLGGHAVLICGYNGSQFIVRNSWGPQWGQFGYFLMPYEYVLNGDLCADFWQIDVVGGD